MCSRNQCFSLTQQNVFIWSIHDSWPVVLRCPTPWRFPLHCRSTPPSGWRDNEPLKYDGRSWPHLCLLTTYIFPKIKFNPPPSSNDIEFQSWLCENLCLFVFITYICPCRGPDQWPQTCVQSTACYTPWPPCWWCRWQNPQSPSTPGPYRLPACSSANKNRCRHLWATTETNKHWFVFYIER